MRREIILLQQRVVLSHSTSKSGAEGMDIEVVEEENDEGSMEEEEENGGGLEEEVVEEENDGELEEEVAAAAHHLAAVAEEEEAEEVVEEDDVLLVQQHEMPTILDAVHAKLENDGVCFNWGVDAKKANEIIVDAYNLFLEMDRGFGGYPLDEIARHICQRIQEDGRTVSSVCISSLYTQLCDIVCTYKILHFSS